MAMLQRHESPLSFKESTSVLQKTAVKSNQDSLKELLEVAVNIAKIDESIIDASAGAPPAEDAEALKWHATSLRALAWSRTALVSQQDLILKQMLEHAQSLCQATGPSAGLEEIESQAKAPVQALPLSPDAKPFQPGLPGGAGPPGVWILPNAPQKDALPIQEEPAASKAEGSVSPSGHKEVGSLRDDLCRLREYDADRCLIVRRIKKLGLESADVLRAYFERFGVVSEVLVAHSFEKKSEKCRCDRIRPAALGFIVMETAEAARTAIAAGPTVEVENVQINVKKFEAFEDDNAETTC